jgi:hypothetical protein
VRAFLAVLSVKGCELVLHRVFSYPMEILRISIRVTLSSSFYWHEQGFHIVKDYIRAISIFNNNKIFNQQTAFKLVM